ncbi:SIMPL domain-containing protein [Salarchaeum japonicum]|uniref:SIMPL domain-containing protein n=1 Tax=Salarchaeum japonicum TaxID=555573 RepID=UPI003C7128A2
MTKKLLSVLGLAVLVATAGCLGGVQAASSDDTTTKTIDVSGSETIYATPDQVVLHIAVEATGDSASDVRDQLDAGAADLTSSLESQGVASEDIVKSRYDLAVRDRESGETYRGVHAFRVTSDDVENAGFLVDVALSNGANRVDGVQFTLSEETRADLHRQALAAAVADARGDADALADAANLSVTGVQAVSTSDVNYVYSGSVSTASTEIRESSVAVTATVSVTVTAA